MLSITGGLRCEMDEWQIVAYLDCRQRFLQPVYANDTIHAVNRVTDTRPSRSRPELGVVTYAVETWNQGGELVQEGTDVVLVGRRPG